MRILICNERLIFRYGVDRILLTLGAALKERGHDVTLACIRHAPEVKERFGSALLTMEQARGKGIIEAEIAVVEQLEALIAGYGGGESKFDSIICGGWPFFSVAGMGKRLLIPTVFIDAGAVPHDGMSGNEISVQRAVRRLRAEALPHFSAVLPISEFICNSQTLPDRGSAAGVEVVYLGVDHLEDDVFQATGDLRLRELDLVGELTRLGKSGTSLVLGLGRVEPTGYKNSTALLAVAEILSKTHPNAVLLLLGEEGSIDIPGALKGRVRMLGFPSDGALAQIMAIATVGLSTSLWEGFNLPIGEMQFAGRPVLAFNVGAHPEVTSHPWYLCASEIEMADKAGKLIDGKVPAMVSAPARGRVDPRFSWATATRRYIEILERLTTDHTRAIDEQTSRILLVDMSNCSRDTANTGVTRVARQLTARLQKLQSFDVVFIWWDTEAQCFRLMDRDRSEVLSGHGGPRDGWAHMRPDMASAVNVSELVRLALKNGRHKPILFLPEIAMDGQVAQRVVWARSVGCSVAAILYDLIPVNHKEFCDPAIVQMFPDYLKAMVKADLLLSISKTTRNDFLDYMAREDLSTEATLTASWLPGQFSGFPRRTKHSDRSSSEHQITCISTIEPRKNHKTLVEGFELLCERHPQLDVSLTLIGNRYGGAPELAAYIEEVCVRNPRVRWLGPVSDDVIAAEVERSRFIVYSSLVEGFGLPILESLWLGRPCLCHNDGVMAELAADGGCLTVDMRNPDAIADAMAWLLQDDELLTRLQAEGIGRTISNWGDYTKEVAGHLLRVK